MSSDDAATASVSEEPKKKPAPRSFARRTLLGALKAAVVLGGVTAILLAGAWLNVMPGGWRVRSVWATRRARAQIAAFQAEAPKIAAGSVVFLGSSTIEKMPLSTTYPGMPWVNRGVGGENTLEMLERLEPSLPVARPAGVVLNVGANDFRAGRREAPVVVTRTEAVVSALLVRFPGVPIAIVEPIPQSTEEPDLVLQLTYASEALEAYARDHHFAYVRTNRPPLVTEDGQLREDMTAADGRHPNEAAYKILAKWIADEGGEATAPLRGSKVSTQ
jgi:lysophospholipase L1-like esterase